MKIFVPGRICLFGEHTDWAGGYRRINAELEKGYAIICGTNHGVYADVEPHPSKLILNSTLEDGSKVGPIEIKMDLDVLRAEAEKGEFFSYAAGVAYQVLTHYRVRGLKMDNFKTDLPVKKGLSSSAAISVLVARAFNRLYNLKMTTRGEMEYAYSGEITTPSRCGRLDQGCAYGNRPIMMCFDGETLDVEEISVKNDLHFVIVDLCSRKDTKKILNDLNHCYPFADNEEQANVQKYLGPISMKITHEACEALKQGDAEKIGKLMNEAQAQFDKYAAPACLSELEAPELHKVLNCKALEPYVYGGKGVGSQGDGSAQLIVKDLDSQRKAIEIIEKDLKKNCLELSIQSGRRVRKAVIPAAGFGTRLFPASKAMKKELFPIIDRDGKIKPVIMSIVEEAINAGIEEVCIIIQKSDLEIFEDFFGNPPSIENYNKLSKESQKYNDYILDLGRKITYVTQDVQEGFGHAVYGTKDWVGNEPFLLLLGDHLYASDDEISCARQLLDVFDKTGFSVVGLKTTPIDEVKYFGCVAGEWQETESVLSITEFREKPDQDYARRHLQIENMDNDVFLSVFGQYILKPEIFDYLEENITHNIRENGEFQLTSCLEKLRQEDGFTGYLVKGRRFDIGVPEAYYQTMIDFKNA